MMSVLKISSLVLLITSAILNVISLATDFWVSAPGIHFGLWRVCVDPDGCVKLGSGAADIDATRAFVIISLLLLLVAVVMQIKENCFHGLSTTVNMQKMTAIMAFCAGVSGIIGMSVFTGSAGSTGSHVAYSWSYSLGWASVALSLVAGIVAFVSNNQEARTV